MKNFLLKTWLTMLCLLVGVGTSWAEEIVIFQEDFSTATSGNSTDTAGSSTSWSKNTNFTSTQSVYQAGGVVKLGGKSTTGYLITKALDLSNNNGNFIVEFDAKGWSSVEGQIKVTPSCSDAQTSNFSAIMTDEFEHVKMVFEGGKAKSTITFETTQKRAFIDNIKVYYVSGSTTPTKTLSSISVKTQPTKVIYTEGENFNPTGLVIMQTFDDSSTEDVTYSSTNANEFSFEPSLTTPLTTAKTSVTIRYGGKSTIQTITVKEIPTHTAHFSINGTINEANDCTVKEGADITFPKDPTDINGKKFMGWAESTISGTTNTAPTFVSSDTMGTADKTYYAVFATAQTNGAPIYSNVEHTATNSDFKGLGASGGGTGFSKEVNTITYKPTSAYGNTSYVQLYQGCELTISSLNIIKSIVITTSASNANNYSASKITLKSGQQGSYSAVNGNNYGTWTAGDEDTKSVTFSMSAQARMTKVVVTTYDQTGINTSYSDYCTTVNNTVPTTYNIIVDSNISNGTVIADHVEATEGETITLTVTPATGYELTFWNVTDASSNEIPVTDNQFTMPASNVTISASFTEIPQYIALFSINGEIDKNNNFKGLEGETIKFPSDPSVSGVSFRGWAKAPIAGTQPSAPEMVNTASEKMGSGDITYYAVFASQKDGAETWTKITALASITEGTYVIKNGDFVLDCTTTGSSTAPAAIDAPAVENNTIKDVVDDKMKWSLTSAGSTNLYYVKNAEGKYLYEINNNNGLRVGTTLDKWTFAVNTTGYFSMKGSNNNRYCAKYKDGNDWRSYTSATAANYVNSGKLELYKLSAGTTYSDYCTTVGSSVAIISAEVLSGKNDYLIDDCFDPSNLVIRYTYNDDSSEEVEYANNRTSFSFKPALITKLTEENDKINITYKGYSFDYLINVHAPAQYRIYYYANGDKIKEETVTEGTTLKFPNADVFPQSVDSKVFVGWTSNPNIDSEADIISSKNVKVSSDKCYYAAYATVAPKSGNKTWTRLAHDINYNWLRPGNQYLFVYENGNKANVFNCTGEASNSVGNIDIVNNTITESPESPFTYITMKTVNTTWIGLMAHYPSDEVEKYITDNEGGNGIKFWTQEYIDDDKNKFTKSYLDHVIALNTNNEWRIANGTILPDGRLNGTTVLRYVDGQFRYYNESKLPIEIYVYESSNLENFTTNNPSISISQYNYTTYCSDVDYKMPEGVEGKIITAAESTSTPGAYNLTTTTKYNAGDVVPAGVSLMLYSSNAEEYTIIPSMAEKDAEVITYPDNLLVSEYTVDNDKLLTSYDYVNKDNYYYYKLTTKNKENFGWYYGETDGAPFYMSRADRAYLVIDKTKGNSIKSFVMFDIEKGEEGTLTDIESLEANDNSIAIYNLQGQRINRTDKGVYIVNGRKVIR